MSLAQIRKVIITHGLKVTPQRIAVLEVFVDLREHPTINMLIEEIKKRQPHIAVGTVYKTLETYVEKGIVRKLKTDRGFTRYDAILEKHHHLYCLQSDRIEDYCDDELNQILEKYFEKKNIPNFKIEDVKLQINGKFIE